MISRVRAGCGNKSCKETSCNRARHATEHVMQQSTSCKRARQTTILCCSMNPAASAHVFSHMWDVQGQRITCVAEDDTRDSADYTS
eukprot:12088026-Heterocapsa_arctica.AAC.1